MPIRLRRRNPEERKFTCELALSAAPFTNSSKLGKVLRHAMEEVVLDGKLSYGKDGIRAAGRGAEVK